MQRQQRLLKGESGFTLIELVVASTILVIALLPLFTVISRGIMFSQQTQNRTAAMGLAQEWMEEIKSQMPQSPADFQPPANGGAMTTLQTIFMYSKDNPDIVTKEVNTGVFKNFKRYAAYLPKSSVSDGPFTYWDMVVTVKVDWDEYQWGSVHPQEIKLTSELAGR